MTTTAQKGRVRIEDGQKRVRVFLDGECVADSGNVKLVWEEHCYPVYYFPQADVRMELLASAGQRERPPCPGRRSSVLL